MLPSARLSPSSNAEPGLLDHGNQVILANRLRVVKNAGLAVIEGNGYRVHAGLFLDKAFDGVSATAAMHSLDLQRDGFHLDGPQLQIQVHRTPWSEVQGQACPGPFGARRAQFPLMAHSVSSGMSGLAPLLRCEPTSVKPTDL
jgi:hypothetical protein